MAIAVLGGWLWLVTEDNMQRSMPLKEKLNVTHTIFLEPPGHRGAPAPVRRQRGVRGSSRHLLGFLQERQDKQLKISSFK